MFWLTSWKGANVYREPFLTHFSRNECIQKCPIAHWRNWHYENRPPISGPYLESSEEQNPAVVDPEPRAVSRILMRERQLFLTKQRGDKMPKTMCCIEIKISLSFFLITITRGQPPLLLAMISGKMIFLVKGPGDHAVLLEALGVVWEKCRAGYRA